MGGWGATALLALGFLWALGIENLRPFLFLFALAVIVALAGKVAAGLPGPRWRIALRSVAAVTIGLLLVIPSLALTGLYEGASASLPHSVVQGDSGNGWVKIFQQTETMGAASLCDRIAIIDHGRLLSVGTVPELLNSTSSATLEDAFIRLVG